MAVERPYWGLWHVLCFMTNDQNGQTDGDRPPGGGDTSPLGYEFAEGAADRWTAVAGQNTQLPGPRPVCTGFSDAGTGDGWSDGEYYGTWPPAGEQPRGWVKEMWAALQPPAWEASGL